MLVSAHKCLSLLLYEPSKYFLVMAVLAIIIKVYRIQHSCLNPTYHSMQPIAAYFTSVSNCTNAHMQRGSAQYLARCTRIVVVTVHPHVANPTFVYAPRCVCHIASVLMVLCWIKPM